VTILETPFDKNLKIISELMQLKRDDMPIAIHTLMMSNKAFKFLLNS